MNARELAALLALGAVWGGSYLFIRVAVPELGPFPLMASRVLLAAALLVLLPAVRRGFADLRRNAGGLLVLGATNAAIPFSLIAAAELHLTASLAAILTATVPLFSTTIHAVWVRERVSLRTVGAVLLGIAGVGILVGWSPMPATPATFLAAGAVLVASAGYAFAGIYAKYRLADVAPAALAFGQQLAAAAWLVVPAAVTIPTTLPSTPALTATLALATLSTALAYLLYFYLIAHIGPTRTPLVTYLIPVFGTAWGALFLDEPLSPGVVVGLACILASITFTLPRRHHVPHPAATPLRPSVPPTPKG